MPDPAIDDGEASVLPAPRESAHPEDALSDIEQPTEVDAVALATLLARVAQTTTGVVITLMDEATGPTPILPTDSLSALVAEFDWVSSVIRRQIESA